MTLADRLRAARFAGFVGRGPELSLIDRMLSTESEPASCGSTARAASASPLSCRPARTAPRPRATA
jgi:hypothetical protein